MEKGHNMSRLSPSYKLDNVWKSVDIQGSLETVVQLEIIENNLSLNNKNNLPVSVSQPCCLSLSASTHLSIFDFNTSCHICP